jgi:hypothetical protein
VDLRARGMCKERMGVNGVERQAEMKQLARERERERTDEAECGSLIDLNSHTFITFSLYILFIFFSCSFH